MSFCQNLTNNWTTKETYLWRKSNTKCYTILGIRINFIYILYVYDCMKDQEQIFVFQCYNAFGMVFNK